MEMVRVWKKNSCSKIYEIFDFNEVHANVVDEKCND
jgi:hypothetical protein